MESYKSEGFMKDGTRVALLEQSIGHINETMIRMEKRFDYLDKTIEIGFSRVDKQIEEVRTLSWSHFRWTIGAVMALFGSIVTAIIKGHIA